MKPIDHPEFFRFPAPPGLSRESAIVLSRTGEFFHEGGRVEKPALAAAMHTWLSYHPDDGRVILENGFDWCYIKVEDTAHFVKAIHEVSGAPSIELLSGHTEALRASTVSVDEDGVVLVQVLPRGAKTPQPARFLREAQLGLAPWLIDEHTIRIGEQSFQIQPRLEPSTDPT